jgi:RNA polymerase sigma factor (sigma-70 family)
VALQWDPEAGGAGPEQQLQTAWTRATTLQAIAKLSRRRAEALRLRYLAELDYSEIARMLGTTLGGAKMTVSRARNDLRRLLTESENKEE